MLLVTPPPDKTSASPAQLEHTVYALMNGYWARLLGRPVVCYYPKVQLVGPRAEEI